MISRKAVMNYPIRRDHYDEENGNVHFINGIESVMEWVEELPDVVEAPTLDTYVSVKDVVKIAHFVISALGENSSISGGMDFFIEVLLSRTGVDFQDIKNGFDDIEDSVENTPTINTEQKRGKWIKSKERFITPGFDPVWVCSECGKGRHVYGVEHGSYGADIADGQWVSCPNCNARMVD